MDLQYYPFEKRASYPHMMPLDVPIWERFIALHPGMFNMVAYDVAVGSGAPFDTTVVQETGANVGRLYQRKIDVIGFNDKLVTVIELKPRASTASIGQVKGYAKLFKRDFEPVLDVIALVVTDTLMPDMEFVAKDEGVLIEIV